MSADAHEVAPALFSLSMELAPLLEDTVAFARRFVVLGAAELDAIALWNAHTYVYMSASATPYLHAYSAEPGSGKTTLLDVLALTACNPIQADNLSEAVLFRLIDSRHPTLLFDEVDAVFNKRRSDATEGIRQILNSGYRKGKQAFRCVGPSHALKAFDVFGPKAIAGLNELPGTLAHRSIPIEMKPPRPGDVYEDLDIEEAQETAATLRSKLGAWATESREILADQRLKPPKLPQLDARANEIWRPLLRIADQAGCEWSARARRAATELCGRSRRHTDASASVKLLHHIRGVFGDERIACKHLVEVLNNEETFPYGGWNDGNGLTTRELGKKLAPYGIYAKPIRIHGERAGNGYERAQFEDAWSRYVPPADFNEYTGTTSVAPNDPAALQPVQDPSVPVAAPHSIRDEEGVVPVVPVVPADPPPAPLRLLTDDELERLDAPSSRRRLRRGES
jgi:hypothetical protein